MKRAFLIFLAMLLPLQAVVAAERGFAHAMQEQQDARQTLAHTKAHADHVSHHHHDDGAVDFDNSQASVKHLLDCDQGGSLTVILPSAAPVAFNPMPQHAPALYASVFPERTTSPPLRPPHAPA